MPPTSTGAEAKWNWELGESPETRQVPAALPSLRQSASVAPSVAEKKRSPPTVPNRCGKALSRPGQRSATSRVPSAVPSVRQSSRPVVGVTASKRVCEPIVEKNPERPGSEPSPGVVLRSPTRTGWGRAAPATDAVPHTISARIAAR